MSNPPPLPRPDNAVWSAWLDDWDRSLRAQSKPHTTRYGYELSVRQLADWLAEHSPDGDAPAAAADPTRVTRAHVEGFLAHFIATRSAGGAKAKYKTLTQFFRYLESEDVIDRSPLAHVPCPRAQQRLIPVLADDAVSAILATCSGKSFLERRDTAILRCLLDTGGRVSEVAGLTVHDVDLSVDLLRLHGKGGKDRAVPFGPKTGQALTRYLRDRTRHPAAHLDALWLDARARVDPLGVQGIKIMVRRRGELAGVPRMHAHRFRHTLAHEWLINGGNETDLMRIMGWSSREMLGRYGASAADERAQATHRRMGLGERV